VLPAPIESGIRPTSILELINAKLLSASVDLATNTVLSVQSGQLRPMGQVNDHVRFLSAAGTPGELNNRALDERVIQRLWNTCMRRPRPLPEAKKGEAQVQMGSRKKTHIMPSSMASYKT
jgi:hypothetical protein